MVLQLACAQAGEIEPRAFTNAPVGINFLLAGYAYSEGGLATAAASPIQDAQLTMHTEVLAYARTLDLWGRSGKFDIILPYSELSGTAMFEGQLHERNVSGFQDPLVRISTKFYGAPALSMQDFATYRQNTIIGGSLQISAPQGKYDADRLVNLGANRWFIKPVFGISKELGPVAIELSTGFFLFTDNDAYFNGKTLEQDPVWTTQLHLTYSFGRGMWAALSGTYDDGGGTTVNSQDRDDRQGNSRIGATLALPISARHSIKLYASSGVSTRTGTDYDLLGAVWQYRWGSGL